MVKYALVLLLCNLSIKTRESQYWTPRLSEGMVRPTIFSTILIGFARLLFLWLEQLEEVKYFKMNDEPNKAGLSMAEVQEIQKHLADVPAD